MSRVPLGRGSYVDEVIIKPTVGGLGSPDYPVYTKLTSMSSVTISASVDNSDVIAALASGVVVDSGSVDAVIYGSGSSPIKVTDGAVEVTGAISASVDNSDVIAALASGVVVDSGNINAIVTGTVGSSGIIYRDNVITVIDEDLMTSTYASGVVIDISNSNKANIYIKFTKGAGNMYLKAEFGDSISELYNETILVTSSSGVTMAYPIEYKFISEGSYRLELEPVDKYMVISVKDDGTPCGSGMVKVKLGN